MNKLTNFIESQQLDKELIFHLFKRADELRKNEDKDFGKGNKVKVNKSLEGKVLATLFYEPSTRTRLSFETAMLRLGGSVVSTENAKEFSSAVKGESMEDTARIVSAYADGIVIRHYEEGASARAASVSKVPILNAGDGCGQHPSQALLDVYTIYREVGKLDGVSVAMVGDLSHGRTVRSLSYLLGKFEGVKITFVSPKSFGVGQDIKEYLDKHNVKWSETESLEEVISKVDIIYLTRIQKERMVSKLVGYYYRNNFLALLCSLAGMGKKQNECSFENNHHNSCRPYNF
ncbi:MAG: aspartate carbamoyltransferase [Candidatus Diapherotrites archaeon]|nr:aspartate carbamoyltransferase [Candidatus Diapherotrites archaeon]